MYNYILPTRQKKAFEKYRVLISITYQYDTLP